VDDISTVVVEPGCTAHVTAEGNLRIDVAVAAPGARGQPQAPPAAADASAADAADPVELALFSHRFMGIAEQMGRTLQCVPLFSLVRFSHAAVLILNRRTAVSTNIKERLDFSCALFGPDGGLVANAPHLPVHRAWIPAELSVACPASEADS
jgi:5-oxoprolinase (ATP-hydrolysing)